MNGKNVQIIFGQNTKTPEEKRINNLKNVTRCGVCFVGKINVTLTRSTGSRDYHLFHRKWAKCATHSF